MEALSKKERYTFAGVLFNLLLQLIFWAMQGFQDDSRAYGLGFYPFDKYQNFSRYSTQEFLVYGFVPLAIFAIYYFLLRKK
jgi:hypothetical protein